MYTDQIVSTYWVSSAQCIPNSQYIVTLYRMMQNVCYIIIIKIQSFLVYTCISSTYSSSKAEMLTLMFQFQQTYQKRYMYIISSTVSTSRLKVKQGAGRQHT